MKAPVINKRDMFSMQKRVRRLEIKRYKQKIQRQIISYREQIQKINKYLAENGKVIPKVSIHPFPRVRMTRKSERRFW